MGLVRSEMGRWQNQVSAERLVPELARKLVATKLVSTQVSTEKADTERQIVEANEG